MGNPAHFLEKLLSEMQSTKKSIWSLGIEPPIHTFYPECRGKTLLQSLRPSIYWISMWSQIGEIWGESGAINGDQTSRQYIKHYCPTLVWNPQHSSFLSWSFVFGKGSLRGSLPSRVECKSASFIMKQAEKGVEELIVLSHLPMNGAPISPTACPQTRRYK